LALKLGIYDVNGMMENISSKQFFDWFKYFNKEPWGYDIENYRHGIVASSVLNSVRGKSSDKIWTPNDFFNFDNISNVKKNTDEENFNAMQMIAGAYNNK